MMGILLMRKPQVYLVQDIEILHYVLTDNNHNNANSLEVKKCVGCAFGIKNNNNCIIKLTRKYSILIKSRVTNKREGNEIITVIEQMIVDLETDIDNIKKDDYIPINDINLWVGVEQIRHELLTNLMGKYNGDKIFALYLENYHKQKNNYIFYTDGSLKQKDNRVEMGLGWILIEDNMELQCYNSKLEGWCSSTRAEIMAILTALLVIVDHSEVNIFTDSKNAVSIFNSYRRKFDNYRSYIKMDNQILWQLIFQIIEKLGLKVNLYKVKAHDNNKWNDRADEEANKGREGNMIRIKNVLSKYYYQLNHFNLDIDKNPRKFIKDASRLLIDREFKELQRNENIEKETDLQFSIKVINEKYRKKGLNVSKFRNFKDHNLKAFCVKKFLNELPTLEILKIRRPDLYKKDLKCIRCHKENETLEHLWNCSEATNDINIIGIKSRRFLNKELYGIKGRDELIDEVYKYTKTEKILKLFNTKENTKWYRMNNDTRKDKTYIWDGFNAIDILLKGKIPFELISIFTKYFKKKAKRDKILMKWLVKLNVWFLNLIWKKRNKDVIEWENNNNITAKDKKLSIKIRREIRVEQMKKVKEKCHTDSLDTYDAIRHLIGCLKRIRGHSYLVYLVTFRVYF
jgi:ribonuclease HI